jgi:hypothetical protein
MKYARSESPEVLGTCIYMYIQMEKLKEMHVLVLKFVLLSGDFDLKYVREM